MPSDRKYSRSRSPVDDRTNRRKHESDRRRRASPAPARRRERSNDRYHDRRRPERGDERRDDRRYRDRHVEREHDDRYRGSRDHRNSRERSGPPPARTLDRSGTHRISSTKIESTDRDYGRLKSPPRDRTIRSPHQDQSSGDSRKRKAEADLEDSTTTQSSGRRSRFDKDLDPKQIKSASPAAPGLSTALASAGKSIQDSQTSLTPADTPKIASAASDEEKIRQRQERLAQWKRKKAEEQAQKADTSTSEPLGSVVEINKKGANAGSTLDHKSSRPIMLNKNDGIISMGNDSSTLGQGSTGSTKPTVSIGKFGMSAKTNTASTSFASKKIDFEGDDGNDRKQLPDLAVPSLTSGSLQGGSNAEIPSEEEELDPLDAFMAQNDTALSKTGSYTRSAGDVLNDQESDIDENEYREEEDILALAAKRAALKKKDIAAVDHSKLVYEDFRKDFYVEPEEFSQLTEEEVDAMRLELDGIVIRGKDCPKPVSNWGQCGLSAATLEQIELLDYDAPTSIQAQAIPAIMSGRDTIGVAKTGSGKTVAFLLPMFRHIKDQRPLESMEGPIAMILTPTRELAVQIHKECKPFLKALDLRAVCVYGGPPIKDQIAEFKRGAEIVVCTPGRMIDILAANQGRVTNLRRVTYTVLDEADRMFDLGFEPQVMKIINNIRPQKQTVLFSATFPKSMEALARKILRGKPVEITVGARSVVAPEITQLVEVRPPDPDTMKFNRVLEILGDLYNTDEDARTLIFVDRQEAADSLLSQLMRKGYPCNALHGGKDQYDRDSTISDFKAGIFPIMIATSVAARGLDVKQLKLVINYDCPNHMEDYVHRVGRTGRAGNKGTAITFVGADQERYAFDIAKALRLSQVEIPEPLKKLSDAFAAKVKSGQEKGSSSGFGGKGLAKFNIARDKDMKIQRKIYGEDEDVEVDEARKAVPDDDDDDSDDDNRVNPEEVKAVAEMGTSASADAPIRVERVTAQSRQTPTSKPNVGTKALDPVAAARARIDAINNRIKTGSKPLDQVASNPDAGEFRAMMEINDYPQKARWNVTNRTNIAKVLEATGTSITTQGQYVKPGSTAPAGVPKLYLLVEGPTEICVTDAVKELRRLLSEGTLADADAGSTRYKVV